jgi:hypothetical protein
LCTIEKLAAINAAMNVSVEQVQEFLWKIGRFLSFHRSVPNCWPRSHNRIMEQPSPASPHATLCDVRFTPESRVVVAPQPQPISGTRSPVCDAAKASDASVTGAKVMSVCSCRATHVWPPGPFQKAS